MADVHPLLEQLQSQSPDAEQMSFEQLMEAEEPVSVEEENGHEPSRAASAPVTGRHQEIRLYVTVLLKTYVEMTDAGLVRDMPFDVRFVDGLIYQPDIAFVLNNRFERVHDTYIDGPPDIIFEVLTLESTALDRGEKFAAYESHGVREYWLIDPTRQLVDLYHLGPDDLYNHFRPDIAGRLRSRVLKGFILDMDHLWKRILPATTEIVDMARDMVENR